MLLLNCHSWIRTRNLQVKNTRRGIIAGFSVENHTAADNGKWSVITVGGRINHGRTPPTNRQTSHCCRCCAMQTGQKPMGSYHSRGICQSAPASRASHGFGFLVICDGCFDVRDFGFDVEHETSSSLIPVGQHRTRQTGLYSIGE